MTDLLTVPFDSPGVDSGLLRQVTQLDDLPPGFAGLPPAYRVTGIDQEREVVSMVLDG
jgi:hypothetical protein